MKNEFLYNPLNILDLGVHELLYLNEGDLKWEDVAGKKASTGINALPNGVKRAIIFGDEMSSGLSISRMSYPPHFYVPPHTHWMAEHTTVLKGVVYNGVGDKFDESKLKKLSAGTFLSMPPGIPHFAVTKDEGVILELHLLGPWQIQYCNPNDHPHQ